MWRTLILIFWWWEFIWRWQWMIFKNKSKTICLSASVNLFINSTLRSFFFDCFLNGEQFLYQRIKKIQHISLTTSVRIILLTSFFWKLAVWLIFFLFLEILERKFTFKVSRFKEQFRFGLLSFSSFIQILCWLMQFSTEKERHWAFLWIYVGEPSKSTSGFYGTFTLTIFILFV